MLAISLAMIIAAFPSLPVPYYSALAQVYQPPAKVDDRLEPFIMYRASYANLSISASTASSIPGAGVFAVAGRDSLGGYSFEAIHIDISSGNLSRYIYMLTGAPTAMSSDGDYGRYIAVGSDRGEVAVYNASSRSIEYIQASRSPIVGLAIGIGGAGDPYLAALESGGYLYIYKASRGGWAEVGPKGSTAIYNYSRLRVLGISAAEEVVAGGVRVDPSRLLILSSPPSVSLTLYLYNETGHPIGGAVVTAYLERPGGAEIVSQASSGADGGAVVSLPIIDPSNTTYIVKATHPDYISESLSVELAHIDQEILVLIKYRGQVYTVRGVDHVVYQLVLRRGVGETTPVRPVYPLYIATILDATGAPEDIRFGKPLLLPINPVALKLVRPGVGGAPWSYLGVVVGCCIEGSPAAAFLYFDQDLNPIYVGRAGFAWYVLQDIPLDRAWIGYDSTGIGVSIILPSGRAYYFSYSQLRGYHIALWGIDIPGAVSTASYRDGSLVAVDGAGRIYINRVGPQSSTPCTRSGEYLGIPVGVGVGSGIGPGGLGFAITGSRLYILNVTSIAYRCPLELVRVAPSITVRDPVGVSRVPIQTGILEVYEGGVLVARAPIVGGTSVVYLPSGSYEVLVRGDVVEYSSRISVGRSTVEVPGPTVYRVTISAFYSNPESLYIASPRRVPPGLTLLIDGRISVQTAENPVEVMLTQGNHSAVLKKGDLVLASGYFTVSGPGPVSVFLTASVASLRVIAMSEGGAQIPEGLVSARLVGEGPLLVGDLGPIPLGRAVTLPLGVYRVVVESPLFYTSEYIVGLETPGRAVSLAAALRAREIQARILVLDSLGEPVANASISIYDQSGSPVFRGATSQEGTTLVPRIAFGDYVVEVEPSNRSLYTAFRGSVRVDSGDIVLRVNRTLHPVTIVLTDPISGRPIAPLRISVYISGKLVHAEDLGAGTSSTNVSLPFGDARIVVEQLGGQQIYTRIEASATIDVGGGVVEVTLVRRILEYAVRVVNDLGQPIQGATVTIRSAENPALENTLTTGGDGAVSIKVPYSTYTVEVAARGYNRVEARLPIDGGSVTFQLQPTIQTLVERYIAVIAAAGLVVALVVVSRMLRRYIEKRMVEEAI